MAADRPAEEEIADIELKIFRLTFQTDQKARYHSSRAAFLSRLEQSALFGCAAFSLISTFGHGEPVFSAIVFIITAFLTRFQIGRLAGNHEGLAKDNRAFLADLESIRAKSDFTATKLAAATKRYWLLAGKEGEFFRVAEAAAFNEVLHFRENEYGDQQPKPIPIPPLKMLLKHALPFSNFGMPASRDKHPTKNVTENHVTA